MILALGFWAMVLGYAVEYTGISWFLAADKSQAPSLAQNLGLQSLTSKPQSNPGSTGPASSTPGTRIA